MYDALNAVLIYSCYTVDIAFISLFLILNVSDTMVGAVNCILLAVRVFQEVIAPSASAHLTEFWLGVLVSFVLKKLENCALTCSK